MLVTVDLVYNKVFISDNNDEIATMAASFAPQLVDFDAMLMDRPSLFTRMSITTKTKPRESMVPEAAYPISWSSTSDWVVAPLHASVVNLDSSTTISNQDLGRQGDVSAYPLGLQEELNTPFPIRSSSLPIQQVTLEEETRQMNKSIHQDNWEASASVPPLSNYTGRYLATPYEVPPNLETINDSFVLVRQADHLDVGNNSLRYKMNVIKKTIAFKNSLNKGLDEECKAQKSELEGHAKRIEDLTGELAKAKEAASEADKA
ncbi:hypothetical protein LIER_22531 [Lithospermum erythrorhizon]|uniref:Uncharacterized protein n=1 Tax=Lithospermum erythrorhizon TaxID=34254 RepID=A0AAV3QVI5_LITER